MEDQEVVKGIGLRIVAEKDTDAPASLLELSGRDARLVQYIWAGQAGQRNKDDTPIFDEHLESFAASTGRMNQAARFSETGYRALVKRSAGDDELTMCVALRSDIPRDHLLRLLVRASHAVQLKLEASQPSMAPVIQAAVAQAATMILDNVGRPSRDYSAAQARIQALYNDGQLGEKDVAAFAAVNRFEETVVTLAALCGFSIAAVDRAMIQDRPDAVLVMTKAMGMSWATTQSVLRMRAGARGISPGELELCHSTFIRLKPGTARQVIEFQAKRARGSRFGLTAA